MARAGRLVDMPIDLGQRQPAVEQLAHRVQQVVARPLDGDHMHVRRDQVGLEAVAERRLGGLVAERAHAVRDVEQHAALARRPNRVEHLAVRADGRIGFGPVAMGEDIARPQHVDDVGIAWRRVADMRHQRQAHGVGRFERQFQRPEPEGRR